MISQSEPRAMRGFFVPELLKGVACRKSNLMRMTPSSI